MKEGMKAPDFELKDKDGKKIKLGDIKNNYIIVYFYPKDNTPGCSIEANEFNDFSEKFNELDTVIIGISGGDEKSKKIFCEKYKLKITLLSDPNFLISKKYGAYGKKHFMGREYDGIFRNTYILDKEKNIIKIYNNVKAKNHAQEVFELIQDL
ncbi:MAG: thioredoxin-dependent thiol peroxidase [Nanoarchaeota archaeon]